MWDLEWDFVLFSSMMIPLDEQNIPEGHLLLALRQPLLELDQSLVSVGDPILATRRQYGDRAMYVCAYWRGSIRLIPWLLYPFQHMSCLRTQKSGPILQCQMCQNLHLPTRALRSVHTKVGRTPGSYNRTLCVPSG